MDDGAYFADKRWNQASATLSKLLFFNPFCMNLALFMFKAASHKAF